MANQKKLCMGCMEYYDASLDVCPHCGCVDGKESAHVLHMPPGTILHKRYVVGNALGYGSFGVTYIGWDKLMHRKVAIKEYLPSEYATRMLHETDLIVPDNARQQEKFEKGMGKFRQEAEKLAKLGHIDGVVYIYDTFEENHTAYIVMEYLQGETLASYLKTKGILTEKEILNLMIPVLQALQAVHEQNIIHRDISPDNIFLCQDSAGNRQVKLIDFGAARFATSSHSKSLTVLLRPGYSPEEQYRSSGEQGPHTDVYAVAAVMYQMATGKRPPDALERRTAIERKKRDLLEDPGKYNRDLSDNFVTALVNALNVKIEDRTPTADEFLQELISFEKVKLRGSSIKRIDFMRWPLWAKIGVPTACVAAIGVLIGIGFWLSHMAVEQTEITMPEGYTRVVDLIGTDLSTAEALAGENNLLVRARATEHSTRMDSNLVLLQDIDPGMVVLENTAVDVVISTGEESYRLPDLTGYPEALARWILECMSVGMEVEIGEAVEGVAPGCVIAQNVDPFAEINSGDTVTVTLGGGDPSPGGTVPNLVGLPYDEARLQAAQAGLTVTVWTAKSYSADYTVPTVVGQNTEAGATLGAGGAVEVTVALPAQEFKMPNLMYKQQAVALELLKCVGVEPVVETFSSELLAAGVVSQQSIPADQTVRPGDTVTVTVSSGSTPFAMPEVLAQAEADAVALLKESALPVSVEYAYDPNVQEGCVISQSIGAGTEVQRGTAVTLVVCSTADLIALENVYGLTEEEASAKLQAAGLTVEINRIYSDDVAGGLVVSQAPAAQTHQEPGTLVMLTVSRGPELPPPTDPPAATQPPAAVEGPDLPPDSDGWVTEIPAGVTEEYFTIESKLQYRSRTKATTTSTESAMEGWTLYNTQTTWGEYGPWSDWSETKPVQSESTKIESKTLYRYRDKETTESTASSLSGWTLYDSETEWSSYGSWSDWQGGWVGESESRQVETRQVWSYYYFQCANCGTRMHGYDPGGCYTWAGGCGADILESSWHSTWSTVSWDDAGLKDWHGTGKYYTTSLGDGQRWFQWTGPENPATQYRYRDRSQITTYFYWRWGSWSSWTEAAYSPSDTRQVETKVLYRTATRPQITTYYYEQWSAWSDWSDTPVTAAADVAVETRTVYRYRKK